jgi:3-hydroxybutyryl-CoA dehydrogenase
MIQSIAVCGAGTMGRGIAQVCAVHGYPVVLFDLQKVVLSEAERMIEESLQALVMKNKMPATSVPGVLRQIRYTSEITECRADLVIEAIIEKPEAKVDLFKQLMKVNESDTIFATNTSSLSVTALAVDTSRPKKIVGMHFFNPPLLMKLVEIVSTEYTDEGVVNTVTHLAIQLGKTPVRCQDAPGFIVNHVARPYYLESLHLFEMGVADINTIDSLLEHTGFKMGPFRLMDLIGNDINYAVSCSLYDALHQPARLKPSEIQKNKVEKGELGKKTGKGYYQYNQLP